LVVDSKREREGRARAFLSVPLFAALHDKFKGGVVPPTAALEKELIALGVASTLSDTARRVLERSAEQAGFYEAGRDRLVMPGLMHQDGGADLDVDKPNGGSGGGGAGPNDPLIQAVIQKLPKHTPWSTEGRIKWLKMLVMAIDVAYGAAGDEIEVKKEAAN
jgi:hypothetical protein